MAELCLGTVQFGMKYGINNTTGQPEKEDVFDMLDMALENGIEIIDTARAYGTAEMLIGEYIDFRKNAGCFRIISKLRPNIIEENERDVRSTVYREVEETLRRLHVEQLEGYLLHTPQYIYNSEVVAALRKLKEENLVKHIGVSVYDLKEGYAAINTDGMDYIQLPYSILDQRGTQEKFLEKAKTAGMTVFTRSAFLQGLFMMDIERIPPHLHHAVPYLRKFDELLEKYSVDKLVALERFVLNEPCIDYLVFGVDTKEQLLQNISIFNTQDIPSELMEEIKRIFVNIDKSIIFPSLWANGKKAE